MLTASRRCLPHRGLLRWMSSGSSGSSLDYERVVIALAIVIGLIFVTRWVSKQLFPGAVAARNSGAMKVMSRLVISPKQQLLMVQVGRRIVVVGDSAGRWGRSAKSPTRDEVASLSCATGRG